MILQICSEVDREAAKIADGLRDTKLNTGVHRYQIEASTYIILSLNIKIH